MAVENGQPQELDLDKTDKLPILEGVIFDDDVADDAVRMERPSMTSAASLVASSPQSDFIRPSPIDLPSLAESLRSVEERIARQNAEYESLTRSYERVRDAEEAAGVRASTLEKDLAAVRAALDVQQVRSRDLEKSAAETGSALEAARSRVETASHESERHQAEARTLRDSLAARDATIVQVLHSLGERDAQLSALQAEHAKVLPALEARSKSGAQLEGELSSVRAQLSSVTAELKENQQQGAALMVQLKRSESEMQVIRAELAVAKSQASSQLELLRSRDWRSGFEQNLFRDMDAKVGAADAARDALTIERDRMRGQLAALEAAVAAHTATIEQLQSAAAVQASSSAQQAKILEQAEQQRLEWTTKLAAVEAERSHLRTELAAREQSLAESLATLEGNAQRVAAMQSEHAAKVAELEADAATHDQEMTVLMAHLKEARRPIEVIENDVKRLQDELALKSLAIDELTAEGDRLRGALERTRGQLEEREFLIRRLERSESNNANVLGRIQTSMERLGSAVGPGAGAAPSLEWSPELIRIDGDRSISHVLGRRTRIGRAVGCELHIDSSSVSRHHALILAGTREAIIEDLNSTNGVILNGRKVTRQVLNDGDILTLGDIQFRYAAKPIAQPPKA
ncbi:MAG TPA: FHA domain-containing protein [Steroidobacteraceae bacterium]|jgi:chromosome segregation ATPase